MAQQLNRQGFWCLGLMGTSEIAMVIDLFQQQENRCQNRTIKRSRFSWRLDWHKHLEVSLSTFVHTQKNGSVGISELKVTTLSSFHSCYCFPSFGGHTDSNLLKMRTCVPLRNKRTAFTGSLLFPRVF